MRIIVVDLNGPFGPLRSYVELVPEFQRRGVDVEFIVFRHVRFRCCWTLRLKAWSTLSTDPTQLAGIGKFAR